MFFITGDKHSRFEKVFEFCEKHGEFLDLSQEKDVMIILGDSGINFFGPDDWKDNKLKKKLSKLPLTIFAIHGNHDMRPHHIPSYITKEWNGGLVYYEPAYPNLLFAIDGEVYDLWGKKTLVIGGAYSVDKHYRLMMGYRWFEDEQPSDEIKAKVEKVIKENNGEFDVILSHTCPLRFEPCEWFLSGLEQSTVDKSTEKWMDKIYDSIKYKKWYAGHYHGEKVIYNEKEDNQFIFMYESIKEFL